ncbi:MAG: hypothetical protein WC980_07055 [Candidatus Brocadiia bacterium]
MPLREAVDSGLSRVPMETIKPILGEISSDPATPIDSNQNGAKNIL